MNQLARLLNEYAVPLQIWLTPGARMVVADALIAEMGSAAEIHTNPLSAMDELTGPAVLVITAAEIRSPQPDALKALSRAAHPGKAVLVGGTADRDTLMTAINDWGVIRVIPTDSDTDTLVGAVRDAEATLKREVALVTAIDDLDIETTMITSAIDHIEGGQDGSSRRSRTQATTTFALGLSSLLEREHACLQRELPHLEGDHLSAIEGALEGIQLLGGIVDDADRLDVGPGSDAAARRELREETGGTAARWDEIACVWANPATQTNKVWSYLATGVRISHDTDFDANEDIELVPVPIGEAFARLHRREYMMQGLHVAALFAAEAFLRGRDDEDLADIRHAITGA